MPLRIAIDAQLSPSGISGGVTQFVAGMVYGLGQLTDGDEEYLVVAPWMEPDWLRPFVGRNTRLVRGPRRSRKDYARRWLGPWRDPVDRFLARLRGRPKGAWQSAGRVEIPVSDGFYESLGADMIHFPTQRFVRCRLPMLYNPHDLQHLHLPEFFLPEEIEARETMYRAGCAEATAVVPEAEWVRNDLIAQYGLAPEKVHVVHAGAPTEAVRPMSNDQLEAVRRRLDLPEAFVYYPAQTFPHKNHARLLEALALLRDRRGMRIHLICSGRLNHHWPLVEQRLVERGLEGQARFLGYVRAEEVRGLYRLAQFVAIPSLFEGAGLPVIEAFYEGAPVTCSNVTTLPEYGGDAVHLFDPTSVEGIAEALAVLATDAGRREALRAKGAERVKQFTWKRAAEKYRAIYRQIAADQGTPSS